MLGRGPIRRAPPATGPNASPSSKRSVDRVVRRERSATSPPDHLDRTARHRRGVTPCVTPGTIVGCPTGGGYPPPVGQPEKSDNQEGVSLSSSEGGQVTGTQDKHYNVIWFTEQCLSIARRLETYIKVAERAGDNKLGSSAEPRARAARAVSRA